MAETHTAIDVAPRAALIKLPPRRRQNRLWIGIPLMLGVIAVMWLWSPASTKTATNAEAGASARSLQAETEFCARSGLAEVGGIYPPDVFTYKQVCDGAWVLHLLGALYMFLALSIVCDEFFVPALEVIVERFKISDDVAGATFMAAGGSAPELATSLIGTFVAVSDVGFGTIVGSAVFNVLFVIGCCAMFSKEMLTLTWWPLARDSVYYSITLAALIVFFLDGAIEWWEALIQFLLYIGYVIEMAHNVQLYKFTRGVLGLRDSEPVSPAPGGAVGFEDSSGGAAGADSKPQAPRTRRGSVIDRANAAAGVSSARATFHAHVLHMMFYETDPKGKGVAKEKDTRFSRAVKIVMERTKAASEAPRSNTASLMMAAAAASAAKDPASDAGGVAKSVDEAKEAHADPEKGAEAAVTTTATAGGPAGSAVTTTGGAVAVAKDKSGRVASTGGTGATDHPPTPDGGGALMPVKDDEDGDEDGDEDEEEGDTVEDMLRFPTSACGRVWWVFAAPLTFSLAYTIPDVRMKGRAGWFPVSFAMSILWIAVHSNFMVWWATTVGAALRIPDNVMGLTFLAAGTSVPDLLTSVLVARQGLGDMAVSSSIGSNIFDVTVGLPVPWIIKSLIDGAPVGVNSSGLRFSVFLLFLMLIAVIISIAVSRWRLSKSLGLAMFMLYIIFLAISLLVESGSISPPF